MNSKEYTLPQLLAVLFLSLNFSAFSQSDQRPIELKNPSMESVSRAGEVGGYGPAGWMDCSHPDQSSVDIQPGHFKVHVPPKDGNTYLGMVVRQDETWEGVSQRLATPLAPQQCYTFSVFLARADTYWSLVKDSRKEQNFANPAKLRIYGGRGYCSKKELLAESSLIAHPDWRQYDFRFEPTSEHTYILFEIFYQTPTLFPYNGNLIMDDMSAIIPINCDEDEVVTKVKNPPIVNILTPLEDAKTVTLAELAFKAKTANVPQKSDLTLLINGSRNSFTFNSANQTVIAKFNLKKGENLIRLIADTEDGTSQERRRIFYDPPYTAAPPPPPVNFEPKVLTQFSDRNNLGEGKVLRLNKVYFMADSIRVEKENYYILNELRDFLQANPNISVEIMGHTNNRCDTEVCNKLSTLRAKSVVDYLIEKGINSRRLTFEGYGKSKPVATNETPSGRRRNQRVEVKITKISS